MKKWENPKMVDLVFSNTLEGLYDTYCDWNDAVTLGNGNEEYIDPNNKPGQHPDWVWCKVHGRWHPKDHTTETPDTKLS